MATTVLDKLVTIYSTKYEGKGENQALTGMDKVVQRARTVSRRLAIAGAAFLTFSAAAAKQQEQFEEILNRIVGLVGVERRVVDAMVPAMKTLSRQTGKSLTEIAEASFFILSAGFRGKQAMDILTASTHASVAGLGEIKSVANVVTGAVKVYGDEVLKTAMATDQLVAGVRAGKFEAAQLSPVLGRVLPSARDLGVEFNEVVGAMAGMSRQSDNMEENATALIGLFNGLSKSTPALSRSLRSVGLTQTQLLEIMRDESRGGLIGAVELLTSHVRDATDSDTAYVTKLKEILPNIRAYNGAVLLGGAALADNKIIMDQVRESAGLTTQAFQAQEITFARIKATLQILVLDIGRFTLPAFDMLANVAVKISEWFEKVPDGVKAAGLSITALATVGIPILVGALWGVNTVLGAIALNPVVATIVAITAAIVALTTATIAAVGWLKHKNRALNELSLTETQEREAKLIEREARLRGVLRKARGPLARSRAEQNLKDTGGELYLVQKRIRDLTAGTPTRGIAEAGGDGATGMEYLGSLGGAAGTGIVGGGGVRSMTFRERQDLMVQQLIARIQGRASALGRGLDLGAGLGLPGLRGGAFNIPGGGREGGFAQLRRLFGGSEGIVDLNRMIRGYQRPTRAGMFLNRVQGTFGGLGGTLGKIGGLAGKLSPHIAAAQAVNGALKNLFGVDVLGAVQKNFKKLLGGLGRSFKRLFNFGRRSGRNAVKTFAEGIKEASDEPVHKVSDMFSRIRRLMPYSDALEGPFRDLTMSGKRLAGTLAAGVREGGPELQRAVRSVFDSTSSDFRNLSVGAPVPAGAAPAGGGNTFGAINVTVNVTTDKPDEVVAVVRRELARQLMETVQDMQGIGNI